MSSSPLLQWSAGVVALLAVLLVSSCRETDAAGEQTKPKAEEVSPDIRRLLSLPYIDVTEETVDPNVVGVVQLEENRSCPGYSLYASWHDCLAALIDLEGNAVHTWVQTGCKNWENCELLPNGDLLVVGSDLMGREAPTVEDARFLMRLSWDGEVLWKRYLMAHHDVEVTPQDRILVLTVKRRRIPQVSTEMDTGDNYMTLLSQEGEVLEERSLYDALTSTPSELTLESMQVVTQGRNKRIDLIHANSIEWMHRENLFDKHPIYGPTNVLVCVRHQNTLAIIDWQTNKLLWAWGQGEIQGPHDAHVLDNGNILLLDNGVGRKWSRVIELDPLSKKIVWEYQAPDPADFYVHTRGACQRLPNGNTLITNSPHGQAFEVTPKGEIVWEFFNPSISQRRKRVTFARVKRYELAYVEPMLLDAYGSLKDHADSPSESKHEALRRIVDLYNAWDEAEPDQGYDSKGAEWLAKLPAEDVDGTDRDDEDKARGR